MERLGMCMSKYIHFGINNFTNLKFFATVHTLKNYTHLIDSCQAYLPVQYASNIELFHQK